MPDMPSRTRSSSSHCRHFYCLKPFINKEKIGAAVVFFATRLNRFYTHLLCDTERIGILQAESEIPGRWLDAQMLTLDREGNSDGFIPA